jgi:hypothetical protein
MSTKIRAGDIRHCTIKGREFDPAPEASPTIMLSGYTNDAAPTGNGNMQLTAKRKLGGIDSLDLSIDDTRQDLEFLQDLADSGETVPVTLTLASGIAYNGSLAITGEIQKNTGDGKASLSMRGERFEQI